ncbi:hypothetical protein J5N97_010179 [Dioscorea zingiberensis]|uniref:BAH domain-containing protein n=1 Tax=Dioscorea zingiberensis TaxID=325984 RepID=A0A9D5CZR1_9LILI|nr:hypothetical protein J5N97_010179 [Dioscorea zingiberensis]
MAAKGPDFVKWREEIVSKERGGRVVHYYLEDSLGQSFLAAIGTERSLRHMFYVVSEEFPAVSGSEKPELFGLPWRSRRSLLEWLDSFLPKQSTDSDESDLTHDSCANVSAYGLDYPENNHQDYVCCSLNGRNSEDITWSNTPWRCSKQLRHHQAFCQNGITITAQSFVFIKSDGETRSLAYVEDMHEDKKGHKKVKDRWFHQRKEFQSSIPPSNLRTNEVYIAPNSQVISAECVDDFATILTPEHYEKCMAKFPNASSAEIYLCRCQYIKNKFKPFDTNTLHGYFEQPFMSCLDICSLRGDQDKLAHETAIRWGRPKRVRCLEGNHEICDYYSNGMLTRETGMMTVSYKNLRCGLHYKRRLLLNSARPCRSPILLFMINKKIELLCQDSGIRGCWFKCTILQLSQKLLKVRYDDVEDEDECGNLEEWVPALRLADPDKLGIRCTGRLTIRPYRSSSHLPENTLLQIGNVADAWWSNGWWEGVIIGVNFGGSNNVQVYLPGEDLLLTCQKRNLRVSRDWVNSKWVNIKSKPDILSAISRVSLRAK